MNIIKRVIIKYFELEPEPCESCETLKMQLEIANHEKRKLLETILDFAKPIVEERPENLKVVEPIRPKAATWRIRQQELERNDRETAIKLEEVRNRDKEIAKLEEEVGVADAKSV